MNNAKKNRKKIRYYAEMLIPALLVSAGGYLLWRRLLFPYYFSNIPNYFLMAALFFAMTSVYLFLIGAIEILSRGVYPSESPLRWRSMLIIASVGGLLVSVVAGLLEYIYELDLRREVVKPSYEVAYVIDDSGSMLKNDPYYLRLTALQTINEKLCESGDGRTFKAGLVRFSDEINCTVPLRYLDDEQKGVIEQNLYKKSGGKTYMEPALYEAIGLYSDELNDSGDDKAKSILFFTDGKTTKSFDESQVVNSCIDKGLKIDAIALGNDIDKSSLRKLTGGTGGRLMMVPDSDYILYTYYALVGGENIKRCLLVPTIDDADNKLYLHLMRIIFLTIIGTLIGLMADVMLKYRPFIDRHIKWSPVVVVLSVILLTILNASIIGLMIMLICFLLPFFDRIKGVRRKRVKFRIKKRKARKKTRMLLGRAVPLYSRCEVEADSQVSAGVTVDLGYSVSRYE